MENKKDDGGPAMESTMRDYFAAMALQGLMAGWCVGPDRDIRSEDDIIDQAWRFADAMLEARKK